MSDSSSVAQRYTPTRSSLLTFQEITEHNWRTVANLRPFPQQEGNLASNPMSMVEAHYSEDAWMRAIYASDPATPLTLTSDTNGNEVGTGTIVGFLMMAIWPPTEGYYIWRFMIDKKYQGLGYGKRAVVMAIRHVKENYPEAKSLGLHSTPRDGMPGKVEAKDSPWEFYAKLGFRETRGPDEDGEVLMEIDL